ncbi:MAG TPA: citramalate synthase [Dehalococcoidia bacterium]|jgi:2-isopropylmalate synthase|nr:citramalate synthase [Dehalococcoidia bacterium]
MTSRVELYDTTLRDGTQMEGISLSVDDKLKIARRMDELGVHYIEGGWPGSNPKDIEFFARAGEIGLKNARLAAFGSTRRAGGRADTDANLKALVEAETPVVTIVAKADDRHVTHVLKTTPEENLAMIADSVRHLKQAGRTVFLDAEHFFDGFESDPNYALQCLKTAANAGADCVVLCDTNGGTITSRLAEIVRRVVAEVSCQVGIHTHNGTDVAVAGSLAAVEAGATHVQGAANGYGDMCGNANLFSIIANLKLKLGLDVVTDEQLARLTDTARYVAEIANQPPNPRQAYVGSAAFAHKAGLHADAVAKGEWSYQHVDPARVGNTNRFLISELGGIDNVVRKLHERGIEVSLEQARSIRDHIKEREALGWQYEGAEASFEMLVRRMLGDYKPPFEITSHRVIIEPGRRIDPRTGEREYIAGVRMTVMVRKDDREWKGHADHEGVGPVDALDKALRAAIVGQYPSIASLRLTDFKVHIIDSHHSTEAMTRVLIESAAGEFSWWTVGTSPNIIEASLMALVDSYEFWFLQFQK